MFRITSAIVVGLLFLLPAAGNAQQSPAEILRTLNFRTGNITLGDNLAELSLPNNYRYLNNADTQTFLTKVWGNPPGTGQNSLGMILPVDPSPLTANGWVAIISYEASGYVSDEDAGKIDYDKLMKEMQEAIREASKERVAKGYESLELVGWARPPYYDASKKKLYWGRRLRFGSNKDETLNFAVRILGRRGVLELNIVAPMSALPSIDARINNVLSMVSFKSGNTYAEYDSNVDEAAAYGLAGLIAGGILTKAGFFKGLIALLLASKKLVAVGLIGALVGLWAGVKRFFAKK
jgi:uncharacterized membrane-anchored protein